MAKFELIDEEEERQFYKEVFCDIKRNGSIELDKKTIRSILKQRRDWTEMYKGQG